MSGVAAPPRDPSLILFVGNSYLSFNNGIGWHVSRLEASSSPARRLRSTTAAITGGGLDWHDLGSYFRPDAIGSYAYDDRNNVVPRPPGKLFDVVVMLDSSQGPIHPALRDRFRATARRFSALCRDHGAEPVFLMTWAYRDRPGMTAALADAYAAAGAANNATVIPVGLAFARSLSERPDIVLHMADNSHPTLAGSYLAACTVRAVLFPARAEASAWSADLDPSTTRYLDAVARAVVSDFRSS